MSRPVGDIPVQALASPSRSSRPNAERPRVLLVDDDERNLLAVQSTLEDLGEVVAAKSGEEALRHLLKGEFAVILLDVYMPGMDGYETAQIIRSRDQTKGIPIVFLSAVNKETEHLLRGYAMGAVDYVFKPVDAIVLRSKVAVFVDLFAKTKEIERKARQEQALLDANLRANAERLRVEQELRRAEQRQAAIIQSLPMVLYLWPYDAKSRAPTYVERRHEGDHRLHVRAMFPANRICLSSGFIADDRNRVIAAIEARRKSGRSSIEYRWQCADGGYKHFLDQAVLLKDGDGRPVEFAGTLTDISEQRSLESQLIQAQKMDAIGKLTGGIAHDFNNLLAAVIGGLGLLEKRASLDAEQRRILGMTKRAAEQGSELVRRLLAFARRQKLEPHAIPLASLQETVVDLLDPHARRTGEHRLAREDGRVGCIRRPSAARARAGQPDHQRARRHAGRRHGHRRRPKIARSTPPIGPACPPAIMCVLAVSDTGTGIRAGDLEKVMEPFFTTKDVGKGSGLGLSMVYGFAKQSNGAFRLDSELGRGTTAELWLPRAPDGWTPADLPARGGAAARPDAHLARAAGRRSCRGPPDDQGRCWRTSGIQSSKRPMARRRSTTLKTRDCDYDLVISDYAMPHVSGTEFLRDARELCPDVPALIITGYAEADAISDRPPGVEVLLKPFTATQLEAALQRICGEAAVAS